MKEENLLALIKELATVDSLHQEYQDNDIHYVIDANRKGDTINFSVQLKKNKDKENFEKWVGLLDDDIFNETWEALSEKYGLQNLNNLYNSKEYKKVIDKFKSQVKEIAQGKIDKLSKLI